MWLIYFLRSMGEEEGGGRGLGDLNQIKQPCVALFFFLCTPWSQALFYQKKCEKQLFLYINSNPWSCLEEFKLQYIIIRIWLAWYFALLSPLLLLISNRKVEFTSSLTWTISVFQYSGHSCGKESYLIGPPFCSSLIGSTLLLYWYNLLV